MRVIWRTKNYDSPLRFNVTIEKVPFFWAQNPKKKLSFSGSGGSLVCRNHLKMVRNYRKMCFRPAKTGVLGLDTVFFRAPFFFPNRFFRTFVFFGPKKITPPNMHKMRIGGQKKCFCNDSVKKRVPEKKICVFF